jgi:hypothetical protein
MGMTITRGRGGSISEQACFAFPGQIAALQQTVQMIGRGE